MSFVEDEDEDDYRYQRYKERRAPISSRRRYDDDDDDEPRSFGAPRGMPKRAPHREERSYGPARAPHREQRYDERRFGAPERAAGGDRFGAKHSEISLEEKVAFLSAKLDEMEDMMNSP